uniref:Uncharacterized protein n=1 Tax=Knipowitschia caucasica TaxID=637954 RepID=A0AAV2KNC6_KNICA
MGYHRASLAPPELQAMLDMVHWVKRVSQDSQVLKVFLEVLENLGLVTQGPPDTEASPETLVYPVCLEHPGILERKVSAQCDVFEQ